MTTKRSLTRHGYGGDVVAAQLDLVLNVRCAHVVHPGRELNPATPQKHGAQNIIVGAQYTTEDKMAPLEVRRVIFSFCKRTD